jgi:hypothetical protein
METNKILCITGYYYVYREDGTNTGRKQFMVSHGILLDTEKTICLPNEHPSVLGACFDKDYNEWIID